MPARSAPATAARNDAVCQKAGQHCDLQPGGDRVPDAVFVAGGDWK